MPCCSHTTCKKKMGLMSFECKFCHKRFCCTHQLPEVHECDIRHSDAYDTYHAKNSMNYDAATHQDLAKESKRPQWA